MIDLNNLVPSLVLQCLTAEEKDYLIGVFSRFDGYPSLEQIWQLMDEQWISFGCDPTSIDERMATFYRSPVWILNGLFIEQHVQSLENRRVFVDWIVMQAPTRVADFGGGFGGLARFVGQALPSAQVEVVEPYPHPAAIALAKNTLNVRFVEELSGEYDLIVATDVFEHVPDPLQLAFATAMHLRPQGIYLFANCFAPVILCHLPQTFHFRHTWPFFMKRLGLEWFEKVSYGGAYRRTKGLNLDVAREKEGVSRKLFRVTSKMPGCIARLHSALFFR